MPRTKLTEDLDRVRDFSEALKRWQRYWDLSDESIGKRLGCSARTWNRRKQNPRILTMEELWKVCKILRLPEDVTEPFLMGGIRA